MSLLINKDSGSKLDGLKTDVLAQKGLSESTLPLEKPVLKRADASVAESKEFQVPKALTDGVKEPTCFITNFSLSKIDLNVKGMEPCYEYSQGFVNRSPSDLLELDYYNIWVDCSVKKARQWFNKNSSLLKKSGFKFYCIYYGRGVEKSNWIEKMKQLGCEIICDFGKFQKLLSGAISAEDVFNGLESLALQIDAPPITACCGLISVFRKKKDEE